MHHLSCYKAVSMQYLHIEIYSKEAFLVNFAAKNEQNSRGWTLKGHGWTLTFSERLNH